MRAQARLVWIRAGEFRRLLVGLLRELSDQGGYARHLSRTGATHSAAEWQRFTEGRYQRKYQNAKCC